MKNLSLWILFVVGFFGLMSCEDDAARVQVKSDVASNQLKDLPSTTYVLSLEMASDTFPEFNWTAPDFGFAAGESYTLQIDKAGDNFSHAVDVMTTKEATAAITIGDLNKLLLNLGFKAGEAAAIEFRVRTIINSNVAPVYSNVLQLTVTPYETLFPPIYMIGDATGGWDLGKAVLVKSTSPSHYETITQFTNGGKFRFFETPSWDAKQYNWTTFQGGSLDSNLGNGQDGDGNFLFNGSTGWYKVTVDLNDKLISLVATEQPRLFMIGDALEGWDLNKAVELKRLQDGVFEGTATFTSGNIFRFFTAKDWGAGTINYPYFADGEVDAAFANANDNDSNFKFTGETGSYTITVDLNNLTVVLKPAEVISSIYLIGDDTGWSLDQAVNLALSSGKYTATTTFTNGAKFRFFKTPDWSAEQYNWSTFNGGTVDNKLQSAGDGDGNFVFGGTTGTYTISVDLQNKTIVLVQ
jgi:hypothetical protein